MVLIEGWLQSNSFDAEKTVMTALFGKGQKKWRKFYWTLEDGILRQHSEKGGAVKATLRVVQGKFTRISSKQIDVDVVDVAQSDGTVGRISLKGATAADMKPWVDPLSGKKKAPGQKKAPPPPEKKKKTALEKLDDFRKQFESLASQVSQVEATVSSGSLDKKIDAKHLVAQMNGRLDKLQFVGVDSVLTSDLPDDLKDTAKAKRKALNNDLDGLRRRISDAFAALDAVHLESPTPVVDDTHVDDEEPSSSKKKYGDETPPPPAEEMSCTSPPQKDVPTTTTVEEEAAPEEETSLN